MQTKVQILEILKGSEFIAQVTNTNSVLHLRSCGPHIAQNSQYWTVEFVEKKKSEHIISCKLLQRCAGVSSSPTQTLITNTSQTTAQQYKRPQWT